MHDHEPFLLECINNRMKAHVFIIEQRGLLSSYYFRMKSSVMLLMTMLMVLAALSFATENVRVKRQGHHYCNCQRLCGDAGCREGQSLGGSWCSCTRCDWDPWEENPSYSKWEQFGPDCGGPVPILNQLFNWLGKK